MHRIRFRIDEIEGGLWNRQRVGKFTAFPLPTAAMANSQYAASHEIDQWASGSTGRGTNICCKDRRASRSPIDQARAKGVTESKESPWHHALESRRLAKKEVHEIRRQSLVAKRVADHKSVAPNKGIRFRKWR